jgi:hypothetical protein
MGKSPYSDYVSRLVETAPPFNPTQRDTILSAFLGFDTAKRVTR